MTKRKKDRKETKYDQGTRKMKTSCKRDDKSGSTNWRWPSSTITY